MNYSLPGLRPMDVVGMNQLQLMQMLPLGGKLGLAGGVASSRAAADRERARDTGWEVRSKVAMSFYDLYEAERSLELDRATLRLLQDILATAESMYRVGQGRQADVLRAQVEIARMAQDTLRANSMCAAMAARLNAALDNDSILARPALPAFPATVPALEELVAAALRARPMLLAGERELDAAQQQQLLARKEIWPDLAVGVQYTWRPGVGGVERMGSLMLGASLPIFARGRQLAMREEAAAMEQMSRSELASMRADTRAAVTEAYATLIRARALSALYRSTIIPQAEAAAASSLSAYRVGSVDLMTLLDNRMSVNRYAMELAQAEADEGKAWAEMEMLLASELFPPRTGRAELKQDTVS
jgi:outer membrane protein TolC